MLAFVSSTTRTSQDVALYLLDRKMVVRVVGSHPVRLVWEYLIPTVLQGKCGMILMGCFLVRYVTLNGAFVIQVMFRKTGYIYGKVYITGWHFMDFPMPQVGDFELMVRGRYEGGDGPVRKIRIQGEIIFLFFKSSGSLVSTLS